MQDNVHTYIELALDYTHAGLHAEADRLLQDVASADPMRFYYQGWIRLQASDLAGADASFARAATASPDYCFPNEVECVLALEAAIQRNPAHAHAPYYLGCFWYAHHRYAEAIDCWERAADLTPPTLRCIATLAWPT